MFYNGVLNRLRVDFVVLVPEKGGEANVFSKVLCRCIVENIGEIPQILVSQTKQRFRYGLPLKINFLSLFFFKPDRFYCYRRMRFVRIYRMTPF